jgi:mxaJ protein
MRVFAGSVWTLIGALWLLFPLPGKALGVCADPDYLPYSDRSGAGFENKVAEAVGKFLNEPLEYTWASHRGHGGFLQSLDAKKCDVVMSIPYGSREELTTRPYYISSYVFIFDKSKKYDITSMDSPVLKRVKVGFERETPAEDALKMRGLIPGAIAFDVSGDSDRSPAVLPRGPEQRDY